MSDNNENLAETANSEIPSFANLLSDEELLGRIEKLGFHTPTDVQLQTLPPALKGKDLVVQAQTGSGKTLAFAAPLISLINEKLPEAKKQSEPFLPYGLIIAPTRELALQINEVITSVSNITPPCIIGGVDQDKQVKELKKDSRIVVGTPEEFSI